MPYRIKMLSGEGWRSWLLGISLFLPILVGLLPIPASASPANSFLDPLEEGAPALPTIPSLPLLPVLMPSRLDLLPDLGDPLPPILSAPDSASSPAAESAGESTPAVEEAASSPTAEATAEPTATDGSAAAVQESSVQAAEGCPSVSIGLEVLVIAVQPTDSQTTLPAIQQSLEFQGTPYSVFVASPRPSDPAADRLANLLSLECEGFYQAIILGNGQAAYADPTAGWQSALTDAEWRTLWEYERDFGVRQATWYTYPTAEYGFQPPTGGFDTTANPIQASFTGPGRTTFSYANTANPVTIKNAWAYQAKPLDGNTSSLLLDSDGNALGAIKTYPDGTQNLALTFDSNPFVQHQLVLAYGVINWVTGGLFLGERHIFLSPQVDDVFLDAHIWEEGTACGADTEQNNAFYRMTADDLQAVIDWQTARRGQPTTAAFRFDFAFNGEGTTGIYNPDTLTPMAVEHQALFKWINHTFTHANLDEVSYAEAYDEFEQNNQTAQQLGLSTYTRHNLVTPDVSGLENPAAMQAAFDTGVRNVVTDASRTGYDNPAPNVGIYNPHQSSILMIPRHANNLFYNVTNPAQWTEEYNCIYRAFWGRDLAYDEILENESAVLLRFMLIGDMDPLMFHETNLRAYDGSRTLLSDLLDRALGKYDALFSLPVLSPTMNNLAVRMAQRMAYRSAAVSATLIRGEQITIRAQAAALVPVTGLDLAGAESYGGQPIAHIDVGAGETVVIPLRPQAGDDSYTVAEGSTLTVPAPGVLANDSDPQGDPLTASLLTGPTHGTLTLRSDGSFDYAHDGSETVSDSFVYEARDSGGAASNPSTVTITVTPVNDAPLAVDDAYSMSQLDLVLVVPTPGVLANDTDAEGDPLTASLVSGPSRGTVLLESDGSFIYTPLPGLTTFTDSFTYLAHDGAAESNAATVSITVNVPVELSLDPTASPTAIPSPTSPPPSVTPPPATATTVPTAVPSATDTPVPSPTSPPSTPTATDTPVPSPTSPPSTPTPANTSPAVLNDAYTMNRTQASLIIPAPGVLANDSDAEGDTLTASLVGGPSRGTVVLQPDGSFVYTPLPSLTGFSDTFTYLARDGSAESNIATVTIRVD